MGGAEKHEVGSKLFNRIQSMYVNSLTCVKVKGGESMCFRKVSGLYLDPLTVLLMQDVKMGIGRVGVRFMEEGRELRLP